MASPTRSSRSRRRAGTTAALLLLAAAAGLGAGAGATQRYTACLVTEAGSSSLADVSLDGLAVAGVRAAARRGVRVAIVHSTGPADDLDGLRACLVRGADVTIGVGYAMGDALNEIATAFPNRRFALVDVDAATLPGRPRNAQGLLFEPEQAGYLVGYAAGLWAKARNAPAVGSVGGIKIPPVDSYIAGFQAGAKRADPGVKTLNAYAQSFDDESSCRRQALSQIDHGSVVELQVAGRCGLGVFAAARARNVFALGVDTDQGAGRPWVMTSAVKHVDLAVLSAILSARSGTLPAGSNDVFGARRGGVGYGRWSPRVPASIRAAVARQYRLLRADALPSIPSTID